MGQPGPWASDSTASTGGRRARDPMIDRAPIDELLGQGSIVRCFEGVVDRQPDRPAVVAADGVATFAELDRIANRLARLIRARGEDSGLPVLLWLEPGVWLVAAMLGMVKAGRVFVALDPTAPQDRNRLIVNDAGIAVALASGRLAPELAAITDGQVDAVDVEHASPGVSDARPDGGVDLDTIVALTYTSGSTGQPKARSRGTT